MLQPDFKLTDFVRMCRGEIPIKNNVFSAAMDFALGSTSEMKDLAAKGHYEELETREKVRRIIFDHWIDMAKANIRRLRDTHPKPEPETHHVPEMVKRASAK